MVTTSEQPVDKQWITRDNVEQLKAMRPIPNLSPAYCQPIPTFKVLVLSPLSVKTGGYWPH
jgi:hypothetical protein